LNRFFGSLEAGSLPDFECIVVDQNTDERLNPIIALWERLLDIKHIRSAPGLSHARNLGLGRATGRLMAFPDDDCWYSIGLLRQIAKFFSDNPSYAMLSVGVRDGTGSMSGNRWFQGDCDLSTANLFRTSVGLALFVRRSSLTDNLLFDESLGVGSGTSFGSGEDTDYVFRLLAAGLRGRFDRSMTVYHPRRDMLSGQTNRSRAYDYGCGMGRVIRKREKFPLLPAFVAYDFGRFSLSLLRGRIEPARLCAAHGLGVLAGYVAPDRS
jgi:glycosyltransferase involved in cell wall biosynthesis